MTPKQVAAFAIGPVGGAILSVVSLPVITWFFSQEDVGRIAMLQVTLGFGILLFSLGLDQSYVREFHEVDNKPALLKRAMFPGLVLLAVTVCVLLSLGGVLAGWLFDVPQWHLSFLVAFALVASFLSRFLSLVLRMRERGLAFSMSQLLPKLLLLLIIGGYVAVGADKSLTNLVLAHAAAIGFVCIIYGWNTRCEWLEGMRTKLDLGQLKSMLRFGLPLILGGLAFWGLTALDKIFLRTLADFSELGIYSVAVSFAGAAAILQSIFSTVWAPTVYKWASAGEGLERVNQVSRYILGLVVIGFSLTGLLSWTLVYILPESYAGVPWVVVSCIGYPLLYTLSETTVVGIGVSRRSSFAMLAAVIAFVFNVLSNWWLIPIFGAAGAAVSTCVSFWIFFVLRTEFSIYLWKPILRFALYFYSAVCVFGAVLHSLWAPELGVWIFLFWFVVLLSLSISLRFELNSAWHFLLKSVKPKKLYR